MMCWQFSGVQYKYIGLALLTDQLHCGTFHENAIARVLTVSINAIKKTKI